MDFTFHIENDIKKEYLSSKPTATAKADCFVLKAADDYEKMIEKSIYDMSYKELDQMILMQFKNSSDKTILKNVSILKTYIDFCISKNLVEHGENRLVSFTTDKAKEFVNKQAYINKYITKQKLKKYQEILINEQDKLFLELLFIGVRGRTTEDGTLEEIINLTIDDVDEINKLLTVTRNNGDIRIIEIEEQTIELIKDTFKQKVYIENNGEETNNPRLSKPREIKINQFERFIFRVPSQKKFEKFTPNLINSRIRRIQTYLDNKFLSATSIYMSGMLNMAMEIYKEKGAVEREDYILICSRYAYGGIDNPDRYWFQVKNMFEQYFKQYREILENTL